MGKKGGTFLAKTSKKLALYVGNQSNFFLLAESNLMLGWIECRHRMKLSSKLELSEAFKADTKIAAEIMRMLFFHVLNPFAKKLRFFWFEQPFKGCLSNRLDLKSFENHSWKMMLARANNYLQTLSEGL